MGVNWAGAFPELEGLFCRGPEAPQVLFPSGHFNLSYATVGNSRGASRIASLGGRLGAGSWGRGGAHDCEIERQVAETC